MSEFPRYKHDVDNGIVYEVGDNYLYYPMFMARLEDQKCSRSLQARVKLEHMKEHQLEFYVDLVMTEKLVSFINDYLDKLYDQTVMIYSKMEVQDAMAWLNAEDMARDNLINS